MNADMAQSHAAGSHAPSTGGPMEIQQFKLSARLDYTPQSMDHFVDLCEQAIAGITDNRHARFMLKTAVDELTLNALEHGYEKSSGIVSVHIERMETGIFFEISDFGKGIVPERIQFERAANTEDDFRSRGWAYAILNRLTENLVIAANTPQGSRVSLTIPY
jgi:anti-sigma regulatory factor (Ser/Thr protein kinase)